MAKADALVRQAIDGFRSDGDEMGLGYALFVAALLTTDLDEAQRLAAEADELLRATGSPISIAHTVEIRGIIAYDRDELADAAAFVAEAVEIFSSFGNLGCSAHALESAAVIVGQAGQPETATELLGAAEELRHRSGAGPQAMGDPGTPQRHRGSHRATSSRRARGRADRGTAAHPRIRCPRRARRARDRGAGAQALGSRPRNAWREVRKLNLIGLSR